MDYLRDKLGMENCGTSEIIRSIAWVPNSCEIKEITKHMSEYFFVYTKKPFINKGFLKQDTGVGPASSAWEADILPMY